MSEEIKELYKKLYNENLGELEENRKLAKKEKNSNINSVGISFLKHLGLGFIIRILGIYVVIFAALKFISSDFAQQKKMVSMIPILFIIIFGGIIYKYIKLPRQNIKDTLNIKNNDEEKEKYQEIYCEKILGPIIEKIIPNSKYNHSYGIDKEIYENMGYSNSHDRYTSSDIIKLDNNNIKLSKVHTQFKELSRGSGWWYSTLFCGIASAYNISTKLPFYIKIRNKQLDSLKLNKEKIVELDNNEFNQYYEVETDNKEFVQKIFNNEVIQYFVDMVKNNKRLEINIIDNNIYIRLHDKNFLEVNITNETANEQMIINSCAAINTVINTNDLIVNELKSNNIY